MSIDTQKPAGKGAPPQQAKAPPRLRSGEVMGRNGEVLSRKHNYSDDQFEIPSHLREDGWSYQWNRMSCRGQIDGPEISRMMENGWRFVPPHRLGGFFAKSDSEYVERDGLVLMERPQVLTDEAKADAQRAADDQYMRQFDRADTDMQLPEHFKAEKRRIRKEARERVDPSWKPKYSAASVIPGDDE